MSTRLFFSLFIQNETDLRNYVQMIVRDWNATDEIVQETAAILWEKYADLTDSIAFRKTLFQTAKFQILAWRRNRARDRLVLDEEAIALLTDESIRRADEARQTQDLIHSAMNRLDESDRILFTEAYLSQTPIADQAKDQGLTPMTVYKRLQKIRYRLLEIIQEILS